MKNIEIPVRVYTITKIDKYIIEGSHLLQVVHVLVIELQVGSKFNGN